MKTKIYMIRHAESPFVFGEERSRGLSDEGFQAAKKVADLLDSEEIDCIVSSSYSRARQTVEYLAERKGLSINEKTEIIGDIDYKMNKVKNQSS